MEDFTEGFLHANKNPNDNTNFKKPVTIGKRPGLKPGSTKNNRAAEKEQSKESDENVIDTSSTGGHMGQWEGNQGHNAPSSKKMGQLKSVDVNYVAPSTSVVCDRNFKLEIVKNGTIVSCKDLRAQPYYVLGRLPTADIVMEHPSVSRYHAVLQHKKCADGEEEGWYLYDLDSSHGTFLNKQPIPPREFCRIRAGHVFKLGVSTRVLVLVGPEEDQEKESETTVTELLELRKRKEDLMKRTRSDEKCDTDASVDNGIDWGFGEDAQEENPLAGNPFSLEDGELNEDIYLEDPKKTLKGWFEREGYELEYNVEEKNYAHFVCRITLPVDSLTGSRAPVIAEASVKGGKKKEAVAQCALEACRILDRLGLLRCNAESKSSRQRKRQFDQDHYSSDEDIFLDRTGQIERKRESKSKGKAHSDAAETYESLAAKCHQIEQTISEVQVSLAALNRKESGPTIDADSDDMDSYILALKQAESTGPKKSAAALRAKLNQLTQEQSKLKMLMRLACPTLGPTLNSQIRVDNVGTNLRRTLAQSPQNESNAETLRVNPIFESSGRVDEMHLDCKQNDPTGPSTSKGLAEAAEELPGNSKGVDRDSVQHIQVTPAQKSTSNVSKKRRKKQAAPEPQVEYDSMNSKYDMWVPPDDQTGDGKCSLNNKFGY